VGISKSVLNTTKTKHGTRTAPRPKLFVSVRRLQEQRPQPRKTVMGSSPSEDGFSICLQLTAVDDCLKANELKMTNAKIIFWGRRLQEQRSEPQKAILDSVSSDTATCID
jgi:hypothetical protein